MSDYPEMHWDADAGQWVPPASQPRHSATAILALAALGLALAQSGNIWRPGAEPGQPPATNPGGRAAGPLPGREAAAGVRPAGPRRLSPSLIVRTGHPRPGRGSARPDKETP
jgi:hypothetical protein